MSNQIASASCRGPSPLHLHRRVVLAGHDVRVGHHDPVARHPARSLDAQPACRAEHLHHAAARRRAPGGRARSPSRARRTPGAGPSIVGNGSKRASALSSGPDGGSTALSSWRITERWIGSRSSRAPGRLQRDRADDPGQPEPEAAHEHRPADPVEHAEPVPEAVAQVKAEHLEPRGEQPAQQQRSREREQRRVRASCEPSSSSSGPSREPASAPAAKPTRESAPTMRPWT